MSQSDGSEQRIGSPLEASAETSSDGVVSTPDDSGELQGSATLDAAEIAYADISAHQRALKEKILKQDLSLLRRKEELVQLVTDSLQRKGIVFLKSPTGTGKSIGTLVAGLEIMKRNGLPGFEIQMQPRVDAASNIARATAAVLDEKLGKGIGFSTSEAKEFGDNTNALVVTSGIFARYLMEGRIHKNNVGLLIVDEVHEGSLDYHLVFGLLKELIDKGDAPPIIFTSADFDREGLQKFFGVDDIDVMELQEVMHPVDVEYATAQEKMWKGSRESKNYIEMAVDEINNELNSTDGGDILVFLTGGGDINEVMERLGDRTGVEILPLHGGLKSEDRDKVLVEKKPKNIKRRVILCTNIAETSLTVEGVTRVIDSCRRIVARYDEQSGTIKKQVEFIAKRNAIQRAGRAGRVEPGKCKRLITKEEYDGLREQAETDIQTTNLSSLILKLKSIGKNIENFQFYEAPDARKVQAAMHELRLLGALDAEYNLTPLGKEMAATNFEPRVARMVIEAKRRGCAEVALLVAVLSREDKIFLGPSDSDIKSAPYGDKREQLKFARQQVQAIQKKFEQGTTGSDWLKMLNAFVAAADMGVFRLMQARKPHKGDPVEVFQRWEDLKYDRRDFNEWCNEHYINADAMRHVAARLADFGRQSGIPIVRSELRNKITEVDHYDLTASLLAGYPDRLISRVPGSHNFIVFDAQQPMVVNIHPGSAAFVSREKKAKVNDDERRRESRFAGDFDDIYEPYGSEIMEPPKVKEAPELQLAFAGVLETRKDPGMQDYFYASMVHPVSGGQVAQILGEYLEKRPLGGHVYNRVRGCVEADVAYSLQDGQIELGTPKEPVQDEEATMIFAEAICRGEVPLACHAENLKTFERFHSYEVRAQAVIPSDDLVSWYCERLGDVSSVAEMEKIKDNLRLDIDEYFPQQVRQEIDARCPESLTLKNGEQVKIEYTRTREWNGLVTKALIKLNFEQAILLDSQDIPVLGLAEEPFDVSFCAVGSSTFDSYSDSNLEALKDKVEPLILNNIFEKWKLSQPPIQEEKPKLFEPVPPIEKIEYTKNRKGEPVYAYRAVGVTQRGFGSKMDFKVYVAYFRAESEAMAVRTKAQEKISQLELWHQENAKRIEEADTARRQRELELEIARQSDLINVPEANALYDRCHVLLEKVFVNPTAHGVSPKIVKRWETELASQRKNISTGGAKKAMLEIRQLIELIETTEKFHRETLSLVEDVRSLANQLFEGIDRNKYTISLRDKVQLNDDWKAIQTYLGMTNPDVFDSNKAHELLVSLFSKLENYLDPQNKPLREKLEKMKGRDQRDYSYKVTVEGGQIRHVLNYGNKKKEFALSEDLRLPVGEGDEEVRIQNGNTLVLYRNGLAIHKYELYDGIFAFGQNAADLIQIEELPSGATRVLGKREAIELEGSSEENKEKQRALKLYEEVVKSLNGNRQVLGHHTKFDRALESIYYMISGESQYGMHGKFDPTGACKELEQMKVDIAATLEQKRSDLDKNKALLVEVKKLYEIVVRLNAGYRPILSKWNLQGREAVKFPYLGMSKYGYEKALESYEEVGQLIKNDTEALKNVEGLQRKLLYLFDTLKFCESYVEDSKFQERWYIEAKKRDMNTRTEMNKIISSHTSETKALEIILRGGKVVMVRPFRDTGIGEADPKEIKLQGAMAGKLKTNYEKGDIVFVDSMGRAKFVYHLTYDGTYLVAPDGQNIVQVEFLPAGAIDAKEIVSKDTYVQAAVERVSIDDLKRKLAGEVENVVVKPVSPVVKPLISTIERPRIDGVPIEMTEAKRTELKESLEFIELILLTVSNSEVTQPNKAKEGDKIKQRARRLSESLVVPTQRVCEAHVVGNLSQFVVDTMKAALNIASDLAKLTDGRENWPEVYKSILILAQEIAQKNKIELTPPQWTRLESYFIPLARDKRVTKFEKVVEEIVLEVYTS